MARIVITTFGSAGDLHPYLALGLGLRERGHDVLFAVEDAFGAPLEAQDFAVRHLSGDAEAMLRPYEREMFGRTTPFPSLQSTAGHTIIPSFSTDSRHRRLRKLFPRQGTHRGERASASTGRRRPSHTGVELGAT